MLQNLKNRATREKLFKASWGRAERGDANDTRDTVEKLAKLRLKKAQILGKQNFAEWKLQDQMAKTPEAAKQLMDQLISKKEVSKLSLGIGTSMRSKLENRSTTLMTTR